MAAPVRVLITFVLVLISWVLFCAANLSDAMGFLHVMAGGGVSGPNAVLLAAELYRPSVILAMLLCWALVYWPVQAHDWTQTITWPKALILQPVFCVALLMMLRESFSPFLYFQF